METPNIFLWATQNKIYACLMVFFISNAIEGQLISTGAFEISLNDVPVWSKLETGRIPNPAEMFVDKKVLLRCLHPFRVVSLGVMMADQIIKWLMKICTETSSLVVQIGYVPFIVMDCFHGNWKTCLYMGSSCRDVCVL
ncbi:hypothetical protein ACJMK2_018090 [Sinanodonta woodiana]|uniref:Selenoprotein T n=1 Tax=Sinanodonta woodiana TaxID=1069815 RepID=A0ABD3UCC3_SINWO